MTVHHPLPIIPHLHKPTPRMFRGKEGKGLRPRVASWNTLRIDVKRGGPKTKSGYLEHFLWIDLRRGGRGEATGNTLA